MRRCNLTAKEFGSRKLESSCRIVHFLGTILTDLSFFQIVRAWACNGVCTCEKRLIKKCVCVERKKLHKKNDFVGVSKNLAKYRSESNFIELSK